MIYFFIKDTQFVRCELHPGNPENRLIVIGADGSTTLDAHCCDDELADRWAELQQRFRRAGWSGPFGRDGRA